MKFKTFIVPLLLSLFIFLCSCKASPSQQNDELSKSTDDGTVISYYHGSTLSFDDVCVYYDIKTYEDKSSSYHISYEFEITGKSPNRQKLTYSIPDGFMPDTITQGLLIVDVNNDGHSDILMDLGFYSHFSRSICLIYHPIQNEFVFISNFDDLRNPRLVLGEDYKKYFISDQYQEEMSSAPTKNYGQTWNKYEIKNDALILIAKLKENSNTNITSYSEESLKDGVWTQATLYSGDKSLNNWFTPILP